MHERETVRFTLNGSPRSIETDPARRLLDVLRDDFGLVGTKEGCGEGECGACSVLINGRIVNSCIVPVGTVESADVETIESIRDTPIGTSLTDRFAEHGAVQCGFCIPGMIVAGTSLLRRHRAPDPQTIREAISGNLCRCTGYDRIVSAIEAAGGDTREAPGGQVDAGSPSRDAAPTQTNAAPTPPSGGRAAVPPNSVSASDAAPLARSRGPELRWYRSATLAEALEIRAARSVIPVAGATDLYVRYRHGPGLAPKIDHPLLAIGHLAELRAVSVTEEEITIGSAVPYTDILEDARTPLLLRLAIRELAAPALRNVGTVGGNICNASPAADAVCVLYALDAECELRSASGRRVVPIAELITGPGRTVMRADELLTSIIIPRGPGTVGDVASAEREGILVFYRKVGTRRANALSKLAVAGWAKRSRDTIQECALALGAVGPTVIRSREIEGRIYGSIGELREHETEIVQAYRELVTPISDQRSTEAYRREVAGNLIREFVRTIGARRPVQT